MPDTEMKQYIGVKVRVAAIEGPCYVARCDRTKGITIHGVHNDKETWCFNREEFLQRATYFWKNRVYHEIFTRVVRGIERGFVEEMLHWSDTGKVTWHQSEETIFCHGLPFQCAFK